MFNYSYTVLIPLLPLITFAILGLWGKRHLSAASGIIGTTSLLISTVLSLYTAYQYYFVNGKVNGLYHIVKTLQFTWLDTSPQITAGFLLDPLSVLMIVVVSFVSLMVHIFSLWYMKGEERFATYYSFLSLFTFSMLGLVLSSGIFQIYIFWELVGVSSFLLIGFYYQRPSAVAAAKKAFIVTRFADLGFLIGILILGFYAHTFDLTTLIERLTNTGTNEFISITSASFLGASALSWALTLVFIGGAGKSAMFPLHIWLPDAMEGPTPVSALIHAATMVVAGVFLVARLFPVYSLSDPAILHIIGYVGAFSALFAAVIACTQTDIKRVLAFSTISQIGYMMFALGVSGYGEHGTGYTASLFHLFTHAFFKSLLFLGAGVIIHLVHTNNMKEMGGLRKLMPVTHASFLIACLAIAGIPPFSGFFSKEEILLAAYQSNRMIYLIALLTAALTAFYMFRLYFSIFWNKPAAEIHHKEGTTTMKIPLMILTLCSVIAGFIPFGKLVSTNGSPLESHVPIAFSIAPVALTLAAILLASALYKTQNDLPRVIATTLGTFYKSAYRKFYIDEIYLFITQKFIFNLIARPAAWVDRHIIDGFMNLLAATTARTSERIKTIQSGKVQVYSLYFFGGIAGMAILFIYLWK